MKRKLKSKLNVLLLGLFLPILSLSAQNDSLYTMSLNEAKDYALKNSPVIKNAQLDLESAKKKIWETTAIGLPQINAKLSGSYMLTIPDKIKEFSSFSSLGTWMYGADQALNGLVPNQGFGYIPAPTATEPTKDSDLKWGATLDFTASQLIFSGSYLVGLQTAKTFRSLSEIALTKSEIDLKQTVASSYYLVLIAEENKHVLDSTCASTQKLYDEMIQMSKQGFIEETDVDQIKLTLSTLTNTRFMISRQLEIAYNLLKFQIGMNLSGKLELTDQLSSMVEENKLSEMAIQPFEVNKTPEILLLESQERLSLLNVKYNQSTYIPDIAAFYQHQKNFNNNSFSFTPPDLVGVAVNIPIFSSGMKHAKVQQAIIQLDKTRTSKEQASQGLILDYERSKNDLLTALEKYKTNKENLKLAEKIYKRTTIKYKEGVSTSIDLTQAQNQYLQSQSNYFTTTMELLNAKAKMEKLLNQK